MPAETRPRNARPARKPRAGKERKKKASPLDPMKMEIARELGLMEKIKKQGWGALTSRESGQLGGLMTRRIRGQKAAGDEKPEG